jgi:uncharacterized membrane protein SirB2
MGTGMSDLSSWFVVAKSVHVAAVLLTITGFVTRGVWMMRRSPRLNARLTRTLPHINDTVLLLSALTAAALLGQYPFVNPWLTAKVFGLLAYILLGAVALTYGPTYRIRIVAFVGAVLSFMYVVYVALTKNISIV